MNNIAKMPTFGLVRTELKQKSNDEKVVDAIAKLLADANEANKPLQVFKEQSRDIDFKDFEFRSQQLESLFAKMCNAAGIKASEHPFNQNASERVGLAEQQLNQADKRVYLDIQA